MSCFMFYHHLLAVFLSRGATALHVGVARDERPQSRGADWRICTPLENVDGTHSIAEVEVGNPPQRFSLVPDSGSPWIIIPDRECSNCECGSTNRCFADNASASFSRQGRHDDTKPHKLVFGSGTIDVTIATDEVRIGSKLSARMESGVLLMTSHDLAFSGPFEGLIGLGIPKHLLELGYMDHNYQDGFLEKAGITNFSMCFSEGLSGGNSGGSSGVLGFGGVSPTAVQLEISHKTMHWQLPFWGVSVGSSRLDFCRHITAPLTDSPCAAIVDSGTTFFLGPKEHMAALYASFCDLWGRCAAMYNQLLDSTWAAARKMKAEGAGAGVRHPMRFSKSVVFQLLLNNCNDWLDENATLSEIPAMRLHVTSRDGDMVQLALDPWDFIAMREDYITKIQYDEFNGTRYATGINRTQAKVMACTPTFSSVDYSTQRNGPAWIIGMPIFYAYTVSFNIGHRPPTLSFDTRPCGTCNGTRGRHLYEQGEGSSPPRSRKKLRVLTGSPRLPKDAQDINGPDADVYLA